MRPAGGSRSEAPGRRSDDAGQRRPDPLARISGPTRRLVILGAVVVLMALMLVPTVRAWLQQRAELDAMRAKVNAQEQTVADLEREKARWADPAYVEQQARQRLKFVKPGEVAYTVIGADTLARSRDGQVRGSVVAPADNDDMPWYSQLWTSIELTDGIGRGTTRLDGGKVPTPSLFPTTTPVQTPSAPQTVPGAGPAGGDTAPAPTRGPSGAGGVPTTPGSVPASPSR